MENVKLKEFRKRAKEYIAGTPKRMTPEQVREQLAKTRPGSKKDDTKS